jgi:hypothetical protein
MTKPSITIYDHETGETEIREMNEIEYAEHLEITQSAQANRATREAAELAKDLAKTEAINKLLDLGIDPLAFGLQVADETETK